MKRNESTKGLHSYRFFLEDLYQDAFFRSVSELTMLAPDGKKSKLSLIDLRSLINSLPEPPEIEKQHYEQMRAARKKQEQKDMASKDSSEYYFNAGRKAAQEKKSE